MDIQLQSFDPEDYIKAIGLMPDSEVDLAPAALALAARGHPGISIDRYCQHLKKLCESVHARHKEFVDAGGQDDAATRLASLKHALVDEAGYEGDRESYDDLQNADLIRVIDRRKGMPIALAILYIHAAQSQGWEIYGLNFPGHFLIRLDQDEQRIIADPFDGCRILQAQDLRELAKKNLGELAELSAQYYEPASHRETLIRLQNNIKLRQIEGEDYEGALKTVQAMQDIDPDEFRLLFDAGILYARTDQPLKALKALEGYIEKSPKDKDRHDAALLLQQIKDQLEPPA